MLFVNGVNQQNVQQIFLQEVYFSIILLIVLVPGVDGPGGVLVFAENWVLYRNENKPEIRCPIPRRELLPENRGTLIVACALYQQKVNIIEIVIMK